MNNTKWREIFEEFYYGVECSEDPHLSKIQVQWTTKTTDGYIYSDSTWTHFGVSMESSKYIDWLRIDLNEKNKDTVLNILRKIHVPGEVLNDCVYVYGYRTDVDYIK